MEKGKGKERQEVPSSETYKDPMTTNKVNTSNPEDFDPNKIKLKVKTAKSHITGGEDVIQFRVKKTTKMEKLMDAYCTRVGIPRRQCRFIFDGQIIRETDTPLELEMEDDD